MFLAHDPGFPVSAEKTDTISFHTGGSGSIDSGAMEKHGVVGTARPIVRSVIIRAMRKSGPNKSPDLLIFMELFHVIFVNDKNVLIH